MIKERPILFSSEMVRAILDGRKTQTRRTKGLERFNANPGVFKRSNKQIQVCRLWDSTKELNPNPIEIYHILLSVDGHENKVKCPYGKPGDVLWVRETFYKTQHIKANTFLFKADLEPLGWTVKYTPSIHMPKEAARIWLKVKQVRVERLHDMSEHDAIAEGIEEVESAWPNKTWGNYDTKGDDAGYFFDPINSFSSLWVAINGAASWLANPWVWVIEFEVLSTTGKPAELNG